MLSVNYTFACPVQVKTTGEHPENP